MPKVNIQIIDPTRYQRWDDLLLTNPDTTFFHTSGWCQVLVESYGYKPLYFTLIEKERLVGLLAVMEISSWFTGKRGVSLPFADHCPVVAREKAMFETLFKAVADYGRQHGWKTLGLRGGNQYMKRESPNEIFLTHEFKLDIDDAVMLSNFRSSTRRNVKKAQKQDVNVSPHYSREAVREFHRLNCMTRKEHGLPPQPPRFFDNIHRHVISKKKGVVMLARKNDTVIAGAVYFWGGEKAIYKYGASDHRYQKLRANNLVMWEAIKYCAKKGFNSLDFGRTELDHEGLRRFKLAWGTSEEKSQYYKYDFKQGAFITESPKVKSSYSIFNNMPLPLLKLTGRVLYRHIG